MKKSLSLVMGILLALSWYVTISSWVGNESKYKSIIAEAQRLEEKDLYMDAIEQYKSAKKIKGETLELATFIADDYYAMGNYKEYQSHLKSIISAYGPVDDAIGKLIAFHKEYSSQGSLINCVRDLYKSYPDNEIVKDTYNSLKGKYQELYMSLDKINSFHGDYAVYEKNGKKGLLDKKGKEAVNAVYDEIIFNGNDKNAISVKDGGKWYYITIDGYKSKDTDENYEFLDTVFGKRVLAKKNGKYGYLNSNFEEKIGFEYDDATAFYEGFGAVKQGDKWALLKRTGEFISEFVYDDVVKNEFGICSLNGVVGVCQGKEYFLVNEKNERVGELSFDNMKGFMSDQPCAVCMDSKWGFMDINGNLVISCSYQDAKSFTASYAPVNDGNLWGFVDLENYLTIPYTFDDVGNMTDSGAAPISRGENWTLLQLAIKD